MIGIVFVPARHACKERLGLAVLAGYVAATRARLARVRRWNSDKLPAVPSGFIFQLTTEFAPALVQNGFVQAPSSAPLSCPVPQAFLMPTSTCCEPPSPRYKPSRGFCSFV